MFITNGPLGLEPRFDYIDSQHGFLYGDQGNLSNPSRTWNTGTFYFPIDLDGVGILPVHDLDFKTSKLYACSAYGKIFVSRNNGDHWIEQSTPSNTNVSSISFADENNGIAVGSSEVLYTSNAGSSLSVFDINQASNIKLFPNPAKDILQIEVAVGVRIVQLQLYNASGQIVKSFNSSERILNLEELKEGIYLLQVETENGIFMEKIIKQ